MTYAYNEANGTDLELALAGIDFSGFSKARERIRERLERQHRGAHARFGLHVPMAEEDLDRVAAAGGIDHVTESQPAGKGDGKIPKPPLQM